MARSDRATFSIELAFAPPYDWHSMIAFLAARAIPNVEAVEDERYRRTIETDGRHGTIEVIPGGPGDALTATIRFPVASAVPTIIGRIRRVFDLDTDVDPICAHLAADPVLAPLVAARPGLRVPGAWDGFELAVRAMLGQQITVTGARLLIGRLVEAHGERLRSPSSGEAPGLSMVFPTTQRVASADLTRLGMPRARAAAISGIAAVAGADPDLFRPDGSLEAAIARLTALPGVGDWTAHYVAMRALRDPDAFPAADVGLLRAMAGPHGLRPTPAALLARAERWRPWRAYAAQHLWTELAAGGAKLRESQVLPNDAGDVRMPLS
jgi:AraC family transcriptional regulator, regulatory protein of adaptative response / DNA-3-methyladenine glycosylase II